MARRIREADLKAIEETVRSHPDGMTARQIAEALEGTPAHRTLQYRLKSLVDSNRLVMEGSGRGARYRTLRDADITVRFAAGRPRISAVVEGALSLSETGTEVREYIRQPVEARKPVGYDPAFLESYCPNDTHYLSETERRHLRDVGMSLAAAEPAGTYARQILNRLLVDLSWNSSRLEGNTYSLLDTKRLLEAGAEAEGKDRRDAQMILNHKDAIQFLVDAAADIGFNRYTILNLHAALSDLRDSGSIEQAAGVLPGLKKQWRRSGKPGSRIAHDAVDGQIREAARPFSVGGATLMYPRDPAGPAAETINCGCQSLATARADSVSSALRWLPLRRGARPRRRRSPPPACPHARPDSPRVEARRRRGAGAYGATI